MKQPQPRLIGLLAPARCDAGQVLRQILCAAPLEHTRLIACGLDQDWPAQRFDELHWLGDTTCQALTGHADILHVHHLPGHFQTRHPDARHYRWDSLEELASFWASLYRARERGSLPGLDWRSFADWQPGECVGRVFSGHGAGLAAASDALAATLRKRTGTASGQALLIIETAAPMTLGDYVALTERFTAETGVEVIPTGGCNGQDGQFHLHLLLFMPHIADRADDNP